MESNTENKEKQINEISKLLEILHKAGKVPVSQVALSYYGKIFNIEDCDEIKLTEAKYEILTIIKKAITNLSNSNSQNNRNIKLLETIMTVFDSIQSNDDNTTRTIFQETCNNLYDKLFYIEEFYSQSFNEKLLPEKKIQEILTQINDLINDIKVANIDNDFKNLIIQELFKLQNSIYKYKIYGNAGIEDIICELAGKLVLYTNSPEVITEEEQNILKKVLSFISNTNNIVKFSENVSSIATATAPLLLTLFNNFVK